MIKRELFLANPFSAKYTPYDRLYAGGSWGVLTAVISFAKTSFFSPSRPYFFLFKNPLLEGLRQEKPQMRDFENFQKSFLETQKFYSDAFLRVFRGPTAVIFMAFSGVIAGALADFYRSFHSPIPNSFIKSLQSVRLQMLEWFPPQPQTLDSSESQGFIGRKLADTTSFLREKMFDPISQKFEDSTPAGQVILGFFLVPFRATFEPTYASMRHWLDQNFGEFLKKDLPLFFWESKHLFFDFCSHVKSLLPPFIEARLSSLDSMKNEFYSKQIYYEDQEDHYLEDVRKRKELWHQRVRNRLNRGFEMYDDDLDDYIDLHPGQFHKYPHASLESPQSQYMDELAENYVRMDQLPPKGWGDMFQEFGMDTKEFEAPLLPNKERDKRHVAPGKRFRPFSDSTENIYGTIRKKMYDTSQIYPYPMTNPQTPPIKRPWQTTSEDEEDAEFLFKSKDDPSQHAPFLSEDPSDNYHPFLARRNQALVEARANIENVADLYENSDPDDIYMYNEPTFEEHKSLQVDRPIDSRFEMPELGPTRGPPVRHPPLTPSEMNSLRSLRRHQE